jgi:DNA uptake protein ComE-like DNA-binding protein
MPKARRRIAALLAASVLLGAACATLRRGGSPPPAVVDLNTAPLRQVEQLPGITPSMARRIVDGRPYERLEDLVARGILTERELERLGDRAVVGR